jgi:hypothetical protein
MITEYRPHYKPFEYQTAFEFYKQQHQAHWLALSRRNCILALRSGDRAVTRGGIFRAGASQWAERHTALGGAR